MLGGARRVGSPAGSARGRAASLRPYTTRRGDPAFDRERQVEGAERRATHGPIEGGEEGAPHAAPAPFQLELRRGRRGKNAGAHLLHEALQRLVDGAGEPARVPSGEAEEPRQEPGRGRDPRRGVRRGGGWASAPKPWYRRRRAPRMPQVADQHGAVGGVEGAAPLRPGDALRADAEDGGEGGLAAGEFRAASEQRGDADGGTGAGLTGMGRVAEGARGHDRGPKRPS